MINIFIPQQLAKKIVQTAKQPKVAYTTMPTQPYTTQAMVKETVITWPF